MWYYSVNKLISHTFLDMGIFFQLGCPLTLHINWLSSLICTYHYHDYFLCMDFFTQIVTVGAWAYSLYDTVLY